MLYPHTYLHPYTDPFEDTKKIIILGGVASILAKNAEAKEEKLVDKCPTLKEVQKAAKQLKKVE